MIRLALVVVLTVGAVLSAAIFSEGRRDWSERRKSPAVRAEPGSGLAELRDVASSMLAVAQAEVKTQVVAAAESARDVPADLARLAERVLETVASPPAPERVESPPDPETEWREFSEDADLRQVEAGSAKANRATDVAVGGASRDVAGVSKFKGRSLDESGAVVRRLLELHARVGARR